MEAFEGGKRSMKHNLSHYFKFNVVEITRGAKSVQPCMIMIYGLLRTLNRLFEFITLKQNILLGLEILIYLDQSSVKSSSIPCVWNLSKDLTNS